MIATVILITWVLSASAGVWMLLRWLARHRAAPSPSSFPPLIVFFHLASASVGLVLWIVYLVADRPVALAWAALALLMLINGLGDTIMTRGWIARHRHDREERRGSGALVYVRAAGETLNGRRPAPMAHALLAATTFFLVLLVALGVGS